MTEKKKIMLYFEDQIDIKRRSTDRFFVKLVKKKLSLKYHISETYGNVGFTKKNKLYFRESYEGKNFFPENHTNNFNESGDLSRYMPGLEKDEIPFFVIDTDGISVNNFSKKILLLDHNGRQKKAPNSWFSGINSNLSDLIKCIVDENILSKWGLILVNPNKEGSMFSSVKNHKLEPAFEKILFGLPDPNGHYDKTCLGLSYFNNGNESKRFVNADVSMVDMYSYLRSDSRKKTNTIGKAIQVCIKEIWEEIISNEPRLFSSGISHDISDYYKLIVDSIIAVEGCENFKNKDTYSNAKESVFGLYIKKNKHRRNHPDYEEEEYPNTLPTKILYRGSSKNLDIQYFDFT